jgi:hypothetical protein
MTAIWFIFALMTGLAVSPSARRHRPEHRDQQRADDDHHDRER